MGHLFLHFWTPGLFLLLKEKLSRWIILNPQGKQLRRPHRPDIRALAFRLGSFQVCLSS